MNDNEKRELRAQARILREQAKIPAADLKIYELFFNSPFAQADRFFVYYSYQSEVDTKRLISELQKREKQVCIPRIIAKGKMLAAPLTDGLILGMYGIPAPSSGEDTPCDVALVPMLAADMQGNRLGYGVGYYDRYLAKHKSVVRVGVCYHAQLFEEVPAEEWDEPLDFILTEQGIFRCQNTGREKLLVPYLQQLS